jgi:coenzyme F420 hydrogenase subunit beta
LEQQVHGRIRAQNTNEPTTADQLFFGPYQHMLQAALQPATEGAQWTGITTRIAEKLLTLGMVDAVIATAADPNDRWKPRPVVITQASDMAQCRGMRMGYGPLLSLVEPALAQGHKRLAVIGIPCQIYALRAIEPQLKAEQGLQALYVIGTPCSDNTTTENFHTFLNLLSDRPQDISYLEFRADYHVELRTQQGEQRLIPFLNLPISKLPADFFPLTCKTCVDYTNGQALLDVLGPELKTQALSSAGNRHNAVKGFLKNVERAAGGLPLRRMPAWLRPIVNWLMPRIGPRGLEFARARVEMKAIETVIHLRREAPAKVKHMVPAHVWKLVERYGIR